MRVLFVDDEPELLEQAKLFLEKDDDLLEIKTATSAEEGLDLIEDESYDAVVSDYQMPGLNGLEFLKILRGDMEVDLPFIVFTGKGREEVAMEALNLGADHYLQKRGFPEAQYKALANVVIKEIKRKKSESALQESQRRLSTLLKNLPGMAYRCRVDEDWTMLFVSEGGYELTGYRSEDLVNNSKVSYKELIHPEDRVYVRDEIQKSIQEKEPFQVEYRIVTANDEEKWVWEQGRRVPSSESGKNLLEGIIIDVSERKKIEKDLYFESNLLSSLLNSIPDFVYFKDKEARYIRVSKAYAESLGLDIEEIMGKNVLDLYPENEGRRMHEDDMKVIEEEKVVVDKEDRITLPSGETRWMSTTKTPRYDSEGNVIGMMGISRDVTDFKEIEMDLEEERDFVKKFLETSPVFFVAIDPERKVRMMNKTMLKRLGYSEEEVMGEDYVSEFIPESDRRELEKVFDRIKAGKKTINENKVLTKEGEEILIEWRGRPIFGENGELDYFFGVGIDINDRKEAEKREEFLHSLLRHDLRNKNQIAEGYLELIMDYNLPEKAEEYLGKINRAIEEGIELIEKVRTLRQLKNEENPKEIRINSLLEKVVEDYQSMTENGDIEFVYSGDSIEALGGNLLEEALSNLIENSVKHGDCDKIRISCCENDGEVIIVVEDDGIGISDEVRGKVFRRGFREGENAGSGLGLYLVREIVNSYGGSVEIKDSELGGARFDVFLEKVRKDSTIFS